MQSGVISDTSFMDTPRALLYTYVLSWHKSFCRFFVAVNRCLLGEILHWWHHDMILQKKWKDKIMWLYISYTCWQRSHVCVLIILFPFHQICQKRHMSCCQLSVSPMYTTGAAIAYIHTCARSTCLKPTLLIFVLFHYIYSGNDKCRQLQTDVLLFNKTRYTRGLHWNDLPHILHAQVDFYPSWLTLTSRNVSSAWLAQVMLTSSLLCTKRSPNIFTFLARFKFQKCII